MIISVNLPSSARLTLPNRRLLDNRWDESPSFRRTHGASQYAFGPTGFQVISVSDPPSAVLWTSARKN